MSWQGSSDSDSDGGVSSVDGSVHAETSWKPVEQADDPFASGNVGATEDDFTSGNAHANEDASAWGNGGDAGFNGGESYAGYGGEGGAGDGACRNCGQEGHFARDCTEPKKMTGECYNCGQIGHNKADCPNERVERPFDGECRICNEKGHRAAECPQREPVKCKNCLQEGHRTSECTNKRVLRFPNVPDWPPEKAWEEMMKADGEKDIDAFRDALYAYALKVEVELDDLQGMLRKENRNINLVALEKPIVDTMTIVDLRGQKDRKYSLQFRLGGIKPRRKIEAESYPASAEENMERLKDAGVVMDRQIPKCRRCGELGHTVRGCRNEPEAAPAVEGEGWEADDVNGFPSAAGEKEVRKCAICSEAGHYARDCTQPRVDRFACRNCGEVGHKKDECPNPRSAANVECRRCGQMGHFSKDCPEAPPPRSCRNCGAEGHMAKECDQPRNPATNTCRNCDQVGHFARDCPEPKDWSKVTCNVCNQTGHTYKRCPQANADAGDATGMGGGSFGNHESSGGDAVAGGWATVDAGAETAAAGDWNTAGLEDTAAVGGWNDNGSGRAESPEGW